MKSCYITFVLAVLLGAGGRCQEPAESDEDEAEDSCMARLANPCFRDVMPTLTHQLEHRGTGTDFCVVFEDALQCSSDIIDTSCRTQDGQLNFDAWMSGLTTVQQRLCGEDRSILNGFLSDPCFASEDFIECVEQQIGVTHVVDLLRVIPNDAECHRVMIALATCNVRCSPPHSTCYPSQDIVNAVIHMFFANTQCGHINKTQTSNSSSGPSHLASLAAPTRSASLLAILLQALLHARSIFS